jgi:hypothetical protein
MMLTRRHLLKLAAVAPPLLENAFAWSHDDFWNSKDPAQWTDKETNQMLTHSPWAKQAAIESQGNQSRLGMPGGGGMGRSGGGMGGAGGGMGGGRGMGGGGMGQGQDGNSGGWGGNGTQNFHALVRWESALPVTAAEKKTASADAAQAYIISVSGLPARQNNSTDEDDDRAARMSGVIKRYTSLERKGKDPIEPDHADFTEDVDGGTWRFSFPRSGNPITVEDKDVTFTTKVGRVSLKAKFALKEMMYKDQLAL